MDRDAPLSIPDIIACVTALVSIPYLAGFFHWAGYLHRFDIGISEVELSQADYLLASLNLFGRSRTLPDPWLVAGLMALAAIVGTALAVVVVRFRALRRRIDRRDGAAPTHRTRLVVVAGWAALAILAITAGYRDGGSRAERHVAAGSGLVGGVAAIPEAGSGARVGPDDMDGLLVDHRGANVLFSDGRTIFFFLANSPRGGVAGRVLRVPVGDGRNYFTLVKGR